jgi:hypothetical protein
MPGLNHVSPLVKHPFFKVKAKSYGWISVIDDAEDIGRQMKLTLRRNSAARYCWEIFL